MNNYKIKQFFNKNLVTEEDVEVSGIDIVGDVHGCFEELEKLLTSLGYELETLEHPEKRLFVFLGDIVDRGPENKKCFELALRMKEKGHIWIVGNHDDKFMRFLKGNSVSLTHGLEKTSLEFNDTKYKNSEFSQKLINELPFKVVVENEHSVLHMAHAYPFSLSRERSMYGPTDRDGRIDWWGNPQFPENPNKTQYAFFGHYWLEDSLLYHAVSPTKFISCLDTCCCVGGTLSAFRFPERYIVEVKSNYSYEDENNI